MPDIIMYNKNKILNEIDCISNKSTYILYRKIFTKNELNELQYSINVVGEPVDNNL